MQSRHTLPGWYGLGERRWPTTSTRTPAASTRSAAMYRRWPFWRTLVDNAQMILAKADMTIARLYADLVDDQALAARVFDRIAAEYAPDRRRHLPDHRPVRAAGAGARSSGGRSTRRNPYVDPLSFIQLVLLKRLRAGEGPREETLTGVLESINGIASGLKNTG